MPYVNVPMKGPRLRGAALRAAVGLLEGPLGPALVRKSLADIGLEGFRAARVDHPIAYGPPVPPGDGDEKPIDLAAIAALPSSAPAFRFESSADFQRAYRERRTTPVDVAERLWAAIDESERHVPRMAILIARDKDDLMRQAQASARRHADGKPMGPLDGVPVAIKDELDMTPYPTTTGTRCMANGPVKHDSTVVAKLRAQGALLFGKTNMYEIGIAPLGGNEHHGPCRNPYDPMHDTGGSSSGVAAAIAAGLAPLGIGADGGGSIRVPASFCGQLGLKATWGRVSEHGATPLCWSVGHVGPLAQSAADLALAYAVVAGRDPHDAVSMRQPPRVVDGIDNVDLRGVRLGIYRPWFDDADAPVVAACRALVDKLCAQGATVVEVEIDDLHHLQLAHVLTIVSEMRTAMLPVLAEKRRELGLTVRLSLALASGVTAADYVHAQRFRALFAERFAALYERVDLVVTPTSARTAPKIPESALPKGESDVLLIDKVMRYVRPANLCGHPAVTVPAGYDGGGLPIGLMAMARPWEEALLLRFARAAENLVEKRAPKVHKRLLA